MLFTVAALVTLTVDAVAEVSEVFTLTSSTFDDTVASEGGLWLIDFYAPWCGHCKKLAPIWEEAATALKPQLRDLHFAMVDATSNQELVDRFSIVGFPNLKLVRSGEADSMAKKVQAERSVEGLIQYSHRVSGPSLHKAKDKKRCEELLGSDEHLFLLIGTGEEEEAFAAVAYTHYDKFTFVHLPSEKVARKCGIDISLAAGAPAASPPLPAVLCSNAGSLKLLPQLPLTETSMGAFVDANSLPLFTKLGPGNYKEVTSAHPRCLIAVVDSANDDTKRFLDATRQLAVQRGEQFGFGWIEGSDWSKFISKYGVGKLPAALLLEPKTMKHWVGYPKPDVSPEDVSAMLDKAADGSIPAMTTASFIDKIDLAIRGIPDTIEWYFTERFTMTVSALILMVLLQAWMVYSLCFSGDTSPRNLRGANLKKIT